MDADLEPPPCSLGAESVAPVEHLDLAAGPQSSQSPSPLPGSGFGVPPSLVSNEGTGCAQAAESSADPSDSATEWPIEDPDQVAVRFHTCSRMVAKRFQEQSWDPSRRIRLRSSERQPSPLSSMPSATSAGADGPPATSPPQRRRGPMCAQELADWPMGLAQAILGGEVAGGALRRARLESLMQGGVVLHSDFSGVQGPETLLRMQVQALRQCGLDLPGAITVWRACDNDPLCQRIGVSGPNPPQHFFAGLLERLPPEHQAAVKQLDPPLRKQTKASLDVEASAEVFRRIDEHLVHNAASCYGWARRSPTCLMHPGLACPISSRAHPAGGGGGVFRPLTELVGGAMCTPWSRFGQELGLGDPATKSWSAWVNEAVHLQYDLVWLENSSAFPLDLFERKLEGKYTVVAIRAGPEDLGWPLTRRRLLAVGVSHSSLVWLGPLEPLALQEDFLRFFAAERAVGGDIFSGLDSAESRHAMIRYMSSLRGVWLRSGERIDYRKLLPKKAQQFFDAYLEAASRRPDGECFIADLSQNPAQRFRGGPTLPTLARSSELYVMSASPPEKLTPGELLFAHGWPMVSTALGDEYRSCCSCDVSCLTPAQQRRLLGNGMSLPIVSAFMLYVRSHLMRIDVLQGVSLARPFPAPSMLDTASEVQEDEKALDALRAHRRT